MSVPADAGTARAHCELLIQGGVVVTADPARTVYSDGAVAIANGKIVAIGDSRQIEAPWDSDRALLAHGKVITPGLVNAHLHISQHLFRGAVPLGTSDNSEYLVDWAFPYYAQLSAHDEQLAATLAGCDLLRRGITVVADGGTVRHPGAVAAGLARTGIRAHIGTWSWDDDAVPNELAMSTGSALSRMSEAIHEISGRYPRIEPLVTTTGLGLCSDALLQGAKGLADAHRTFLDFHQSFDTAEVEAYMASTTGGALPIEHLDRIGVLDDNVRLIHQLVTVDREWDLIAGRGASVVRCTGSRAAADLAALIRRGIPVGVGTDTVNVSNTSDVLRTAQLFGAVMREPDTACGADIQADDLLAMCTLSGARTLGVADSLGSLEVGKRADLVVFDANRPKWLPLIDPVTQLVLSVDGGSVESVMIDGEFVVEQGTVSGVDFRDLAEEVERSARRILKRMGVRPRVSAQWLA